MARLDRRTALGALHVVGWRAEVMEAAAGLALEAARAGRKGRFRIALAGEDAFLKCSPLAGRAALRWGLKRALLRARIPRVNEYYNLSWLTERLFCVPLPLAAGNVVRAGIPRWQFLVTRFVPDAAPFERWWPAAGAAERAAVLDECAREVARMHALHFLHHDLWPRNLLVLPRGGLSRVMFLDCWAGGPPPQLRGLAYDLRCFEEGFGALLAPAEMASWRARYEEERRALSPRRRDGG